MRPRLFLPLLAALAGGFALFGHGWAQKVSILPATVAKFEKVLACRAIPEPGARLACFDQTVGELAKAAAVGDVVVVDKAKVQEVRRQAFGLPNIDALKFFSPGAKPEALDHVAIKIGHVGHNQLGRWVVTSTEGQVWIQIDSADVYPEPKAGDMATIRPGMIGSYFMKIGDGSAFRVRRDQ